ncbi:hypothetical protein NKR23_g4280 [Pleurostoma richardsiae]|uniref:Dihydrodipicolinate synthetase n=1 Tax=Pleurostoma richardsiae TaxID=41990 RepID=A0AA38RVS3_9PEZI|nr:hypothetical protein NKR23_g4280 [Pleurostoma richardsiae]
MTPDAIYDFFMEVAEGSPLPVVLYSFPAVTAGIEMDSDLLIRISKAHPNIIGTKFTCGDTGKLARVARSMDTKTPSQPGKSYWAVAGLADFALQGLVAGASGVVAGGANVLPKTCVRVYELFRQGRFDEAMKAQSLLSEGDWPHTGAGIGATKAVLQQVYGYGGHGRSPLRRLSSKTAESIVAHMKDVLAFESTL